MLDPDYLEQAGELTAAVYRQIEAEMLDYLTQMLIAGDISGQRAQTAMMLLANGSVLELLKIVNAHKAEINASVAKEVTDALKRSDADDLKKIKQGMGVELPAITSVQMAATVKGIQEILARRNLDMAEGARNAFLQQATWAITQVNTGVMTTDKALHAAVRNLERDGISVISYRNAKTGKQTVKNKVDVAIRRHIRTQILQDGMRLTESRLDEAGVELVEVSSHSGSRPSHARWEGRVYSRHGDKVIDGVKYKDFATACKVGDVADGIGGANCRHSYGPYFPGMKRQYQPDPKHPSGKSNEEVYDLTQKQRYHEREIRATKRELRGAEELYKADPSLENLGEVSRLKLKLRNQQGTMRKLIKENPRVLQRSPGREWAGDMPKVKLSAVSGQTKERAIKQANLIKRANQALVPVYTGSRDAFGNNVKLAKGKLAKDGYFDVAMHGHPKTVELYGERVDHKVVAEVIRNRKDYDGTKPIRLLSCSTGKRDKNGDCFAQRLADELGQTVWAPDDIIYMSPNGEYTIGPSEGVNTGHLQEFRPKS